MSHSSQIEHSNVGRGDPGETIRLLIKCRSGELDALSPFFERWQGWLRTRVERDLGGEIGRHIDAMDLVQETNIVVLRKVKDTKIRTRAGLRAWLVSIASNRVKELYKYLHAMKRDVDRQERLAHETGASEDLASTSAKDPCESIVRAELRRALDHALGSLSPLYREVIVLRDFQGESWDQITETMDRTSKHSTQELHRRAWIKLRALLRTRFSGYSESRLEARVKVAR